MIKTIKWKLPSYDCSLSELVTMEMINSEFAFYGNYKIIEDVELEQNGVKYRQMTAEYS